MLAQIACSWKLNALCAPSARMTKNTPHAYGVDDTAGPLFAPRQIAFQIVFLVWVSLNERKWVTFGERRGFSDPATRSTGYSVRTVWPSPTPLETSCAIARTARASRRRKRAESHRSMNPNRRNRVRNCGACAPGRHGRTDEVEKVTNRVALAEHPLREGRAGTAGAAS